MLAGQIPYNVEFLFDFFLSFAFMKSCLQFFIIWTICIFHYGFSSAQNLEKWFPGKEAMRIGVQYSPEQWPENQWERDLKNISTHG
ncbi:MAG: hypothetical protein ACK56I_05220, partial [bacterium]